MAKRKPKKRTQNYKKQVGQVPGTLVYTGTKAHAKLFIESFDYSADFFSEKEIQEDLEEMPNKKNFSYFKLLLKGFVVNTLNPFTFFFWGVIAAGKLAESGFSENEFFLFFGAILFVIIATDTLKVSLAKVIRKYMKPKNILLVRKISGIAFVIFGIILIVRVMM